LYYHTFAFSIGKKTEDLKADLVRVCPETKEICTQRFPAKGSVLSFGTNEELADAQQNQIVHTMSPYAAVFNGAHPEITGIELERYAENTRLIHTGAAGERESDGSFHADSIEKYVVDLDYRAAEQGMNIVCNASYSVASLELMSEEEKAAFAKVHEENKA